MGRPMRLGLVLGLPALLAAASLGFASTTERVSVSSTGVQANGSCEARPSISADGRYVVFESDASNLVPDDTNLARDVFLHDRQTGETRRISVSSDGQQANGWSSSPVISADGRSVVYTSEAANLVSGDTNNVTDAFLYEVATGSTRRISVSSAGEQGNNYSGASGLSADGHFVVFASEATNLVAEAVSPLGNIYVYGTTSGAVSLVSGDQPSTATGGCSSAAISGDGRYVAFTIGMLVEPDLALRHELFRRDRQTGELEMLSVGLDGFPAQGDCWSTALSADGRYVVFETFAGNLWPGDSPGGTDDVFLVDCDSGVITRVSLGRDGEGTGTYSRNPAITPDGRFIAFDSGATNLLWNWTNHTPSVFVHDQETGRTSIAGLTNDGEEGEWSGAMLPAISADARYVAFIALDSNFVAGDTNGTWDVFVRDRQTFGDVPVGLWSYDWIEACARAGVVTGYPGGNYRPAEAVTRAQMAVYIARGLAGGDENVPTGPEVASFTDVGTDHWAYEYIEYMVSPEMKVVTGYPDGSYRPDEVVDRGQMAVFIARAMISPAGDPALPAPPAEPTFPDVTAENDWAWCYLHVEYLAAQDIVQGYWNGTYRPEETVTRDQMAVYLQRAFDLPM